MGPNRRLFAFFLGGSLYILFFNLWGRTLENHDHIRYAEVAREMIRSGDWIVPRYKTLQDLTKEGFLVTFLKKIDYGKENLVLVKIEGF